MKYFIPAALLLLFAYCSILGMDIYKTQKQSTTLKEDFAEINRINYGLFNIQLWKDRALSIFQDKIDNFTISDGMYENLENELELYLNQAHKDYIESGVLVDQLLETAEKKGTINTFLLNTLKPQIKKYVGQMDLRSRIPALAKDISGEIKENEPRIKGYFQAELERMLFSGTDVRVTDPRTPIYNKYDKTLSEETTAYLKEAIQNSDLMLKKKIRMIYILLISGFVACCFLYRILGFNTFITLITIISIIMLVLGVTLPMIDIDARLNDFTFSILDNTITFDEQVLYYQSKSILDVTETLIRGRGIDLKIVGIMILMFSVIFPFIKLVLSTLYLYFSKLRDNKLVRSFIFYLGKWSMADVFVVAIFMSYIGFYGLVTSQLGEIGRNPTGYAVETVNYSRLSPGALFFTSYCVLSIIAGTLINRKAIQV